MYQLMCFTIKLDLYVPVNVFYYKTRPVCTSKCYLQLNLTCHLPVNAYTSTLGWPLKVITAYWFGLCNYRTPVLRFRVSLYWVVNHNRTKRKRNEKTIRFTTFVLPCSILIRFFVNIISPC